MTGQDQTPQSTQKRVAIFVAASLALHAVLLLLVQLSGGGRSPRAPEPIAVELVELQPTLLETPLPPREIPQPAPPEIPQQPEQPPATPPQPEIPNEPAPQPDIPDEPAERPEIPAPGGGAVVAIPEGSGAGVYIPGLTYDGTRQSDLAWFGHAIECVSVELRYEDYCADIGPIYLAENGDVVRLSPEAERVWRDQKAREALRAIPMDPVEGCGDFACVPPSETFRNRGRLVRDRIPE